MAVEIVDGQGVSEEAPGTVCVGIHALRSIPSVACSPAPRSSVHCVQLPIHTVPGFSWLARSPGEPEVRGVVTVLNNDEGSHCVEFENT